MGVFDKNKGVPGAKPNLWISYSVTEELRIKYGLKVRTIREPSPTDSDRAAKALIAQRKREIAAGTWRPRKVEIKQGKKLADFVRTWTAQRARDGVKSAKDEAQRLRDHVLPVLGDKVLSDIKRKDVSDLIGDLHREGSRKSGEKLAPRTVHRVYEDLRTLFNRLVEDEVLLFSPCTLRVRRGELPKKKDADPRWRSLAVFDRDELELLISSELVPLPRRVLYALMLIGGMRIGEAAGRRWADYEPGLKPLGKLRIATQYDDEDLKTENPREMPVHPTLAKVLAQWKLDGFAATLGRQPRSGDFICPKQNGDADSQNEKRVWMYLQKDLGRIGLRRRRVHDMRRTLVTLARAGGADDGLLHWCTHGPSGSMMDNYTTPPWEALCRQVLCLKVDLREPTGATVISLRTP